MKEIRFHGRGGQGAVMATEILTTAFVLEGNYAAILSADIAGLLWIWFIWADKLISLEIPNVHSICFHSCFLFFVSTNSEMILNFKDF